MNSLNRLSLGQRVLFSVALACMLCAAIAGSVGIYFKEQEFRTGLAEKARTIHNRLDASARYVAHQGGLQPVLEALRTKYKNSEEITKEEQTTLLNQVPIVAALKIGADKAPDENYSFRVFSDEPRRQENKANSDEMKIFDEFFRHPELNEKLVNDGKTVTVYRPVRLHQKQGCLQCHGDPSLSPWGNGKDILGYRMENWTDGKLHGVFAISSSIAGSKNDSTQSMSSTGYLSIWIGIGTLLSLGLAYLYIRPSVGHLRRIALDIDQASSQVAEASRQLAKASEELSSDTAQQASHIQATGLLVEDLKVKAERNSAAAREASICSQEAFVTSEEGKKVMQSIGGYLGILRDSHSEIAKEIRANGDEMKHFIRIIEEIGERTKVINEIVFQTRLLSFNAAVESARAGEHGKGFAVVAEEIGNLAQMSGDAAKEIASLLDESIGKVQHMVQSSNEKMQNLLVDGSRKLQEGAKLAVESSGVMNEIISKVDRTKMMAEEISTVSSGQVISLDAIRQAMAEIDKLTLQGAARSEETASSSLELSAHAETVKRSIFDMVHIVSGRKAS